MKVTITGRKVNLRENFKTLAQKKLSRFDRIFAEDAVAKVVVTREKNRQIWPKLPFEAAACTIARSRRKWK